MARSGSGKSSKRYGPTRSQRCWAQNRQRPQQAAEEPAKEANDCAKSPPPEQQCGNATGSSAHCLMVLRRMWMCARLCAETEIRTRAVFHRIQTPILN
jgi:hypothetical protein